jgi:hypothetical protein
MSDMNRIRLLLADPLLTQSDVELFDRMTRKRTTEDLSPQCPERQTKAPVVTFDPNMPDCCNQPVIAQS